MVISLKDGAKLISVSVICFCAVFVCTFMLNFYLDLSSISGISDGKILAVYNAQLSTAKITSALAGGFLGLIAVLMTFFYIKIYIDSHSKQLGILKALGYGNFRLAIHFWVFGLSVFIGCIAGYAGGFIAMPYVYEGLAVNGIPAVEINFHWQLLLGLVFAPPFAFLFISFGYAAIALKRNLGDLLGAKVLSQKIKPVSKSYKERSFLADMCIKTISSKKLIVFFVAFSCFCYSAMVQMGFSMKTMNASLMGVFILLIGLVLAFTCMIMSVTSLINANRKNVAIMKTFGYKPAEYAVAVFAGYTPFALLGFAIGTVYQYGLLKLMVNLIFADVGEMPVYKFDVALFFITLLTFIALYAITVFLFSIRLLKVSVKEVMI